MPAIYILIDTDPADNTTTVDCWTMDDRRNIMPIKQDKQHIATDLDGGSVARAALQAIAPMFTGGQRVKFGPGVPPEVVA